MVDDPLDRHSHAAEPELEKDPDTLAHIEARNGLRQFDAVMDRVDYFVSPEHPLKLRVSAILDLHRITLEGISAYAGNFRPSDIEIGGSKHKPPSAHLIPGLIEEMCDYVNDNWHKSAIHVSAYVLWRMNWIHPFTDGNGRTARAISYLVTCVRLGYRLPGTNTIPEQFAQNKKPYYEALENADGHWENGKLDLSQLEALLAELLAAQLMSVHDAATGAQGKAQNRKFH